MKAHQNRLKNILIALFFSTGLLASDRFGYTVEIPNKKMTIIITCADRDATIIENSDFQRLAESIGEILVGEYDRIVENRTYLVFLRSDRGKIYCHVDEEPVGNKATVKDFCFTSKQWRGRFIEKVFSQILGTKSLSRKPVNVLGKSDSASVPLISIEWGPVPGQPLTAWSISGE